MANTSSRESGLLEFVIKVYPDGHFSRFLAEKVAEGDRLEITGPFGVFTLREGDNDLVFVGGGAGMAPILSLLRSMAERGLDRKATFFYGARTKKDLCFEAELHALEEQLPNFKYVPALSEPGDDDGWDGETGLITDVVKRHASDLSGRTRLRVRAAAHGGGGAPAAGNAGRGGKAHLLRQVHDHW